MGLSPTDSVPTAAHTSGKLFAALAHAYDEALQAAASGDLAACERFLLASEDLLRQAVHAEQDPLTPAAYEEALAARTRLVSVLEGQRRDTELELARLQQGKKALAGYAGERPIGGSVRDRA